MKKYLLGVVVFICVFGFQSALEAQVTGARMEGVVTDETQAVVPGATVTITNVETGISRTSTTDGGGRYIFSNLLKRLIGIFIKFLPTFFIPNFYAIRNADNNCLTLNIGIFL